MDNDVNQPPAKPTEPTPSASQAPKDTSAPMTEGTTPNSAQEEVPPKPAETVQDKASEPEEVASNAPVASDATKKHTPMPLVLLVVAIIVLGLGSVAYFALSKKDTAPVSTTKTDTSATVESTATADDATKAIDESLTDIDETEDYNPESLNDSAIGL